MGDKYGIYKLSSGDEVIGKITGVNTRNITLNRPMAVKTVTMQDPMTGEQRHITMMRPWVNLSEKLDHKIPVKHIILETSPTPEVVGAYLHKLEREDVVQDLVQEMMNDPEQLEDYLKSIIESDLEAPIEEEMPPTQMENPQEEMGDDYDKVQMNFQIPPGLFLGFLLNGIVSLNPEEEGVEFDIDEFMKLKNRGRKSPREDNTKDIDDYFRDWNPEP